MAPAPTLARSLALLTMLLATAPGAVMGSPTGADANSEAVGIVEAALRNLDAGGQDEHWYFTMELMEGEEHRVIIVDPLRDKYDKRSLVTVNGEAPDKGDLEAFRKSEKERIDDSDPDAGYGYLVDTQTLRLIGSTDGVAQFGFSPRLKRLEDNADKMSGVLLLNEETREIEKIEIFNTDEFSPAFSVTLDTYRLTFIFREEQGARLLEKMESRAAGKAGFVKRFDSSVDVEFRDYRRANSSGQL